MSNKSSNQPSTKRVKTNQAKRKSKQQESDTNLDSEEEELLEVDQLPTVTNLLYTLNNYRRVDNKSEIKSHFIYKLNLKQENLNEKEVNVLNGIHKLIKAKKTTAPQALKALHNDKMYWVDRILSKKRFNCNFKLCKETYKEKINLTRHTNKHINKNFNPSSYFVSLIDDTLFSNEEAEKASTDQLYSALEKVVNEYQASLNYNKAHLKKINSRREYRLFYSIILNNGKLSTTSNNDNDLKFNLDDNFQQLDMTTKELYNNLNYVGISQLSYEKIRRTNDTSLDLINYFIKDNRLFYKLLFSYLCIKLNLNDHLSTGEQMLINNLKSNQMVSSLFINLKVTPFELILLEKALLTLNLPNISNSHSGDFSWYFLNNVNTEINYLRKYLINYILKSKVINFDINLLDKLYRPYYDICLFNGVDRVGKYSGGYGQTNNTIRDFLESKVSSSIKSVSELLSIDKINLNSIRKEDQEEDKSLAPNNLNEPINCICGCGDVYENASKDYYQHLLDVNNYKIQIYTNCRLRCSFCNPDLVVSDVETDGEMIDEELELSDDDTSIDKSKLFGANESLNNHIKEQHANIKKKSKKKNN